MDFWKVTNQNNFPMIFWLPLLSMSTLLNRRYFFLNVHLAITYIGEEGKKYIKWHIGSNYYSASPLLWGGGGGLPGSGRLAGTLPGGRWPVVVKRKSTREGLGEAHTTLGWGSCHFIFCHLTLWFCSYTIVMEDLINPGGEIGCFIPRT